MRHCLRNDYGGMGWRRIIYGEKYREESRWWKPKEANGATEITLWKGIVKKWEMFVKGIPINPGDGSSISFWHNVWLGGKPLCICFLGIYRLVHNKIAWIFDYLCREGEGRTQGHPTKKASARLVS